MPRERRNPRLSSTSVTGVYRPPKGKHVDHHAGFDHAFEDALRKIGRPRGDYKVHIELSAVVNVKNPGNVIEYVVTVI